MNLYYVKSDINGANFDMMVVAEDAEQAVSIWAEVSFGETPQELKDSGEIFHAFLVDLHIQRPTTGYIEWGTFKFKPVEM